MTSIRLPDDLSQPPAPLDCVSRVTTPTTTTMTTSTTTANEMHRLWKTLVRSDRQSSKPSVRVMPFAKKFIYPITLWAAPYLIMKDLDRFEISFVPMQFHDGALPPGHKRFLAPLPIDQIDNWLHDTQPWTAGRYARDLTRPGKPQDNDNDTEASFAWQCIDGYLEHGNSNPATSIIPHYSSWKVFKRVLCSSPLFTLR